MGLGDMNGRLKKLEPNIKNDENGKMIESWMVKKDMHLLNYTDECIGIYTFETPNGHSAIDHILTNDTMAEKYLGMFIDEERSLLNISDHNLVRAWFKINPGHKKPKWNKTTTKTITWISRDQDRLVKCAESFKRKIGKKISFRKCMSKMKSSIDENLRRRKKVKLAGKDQVRMISAPWVDEELIENIKLRTFLNKEWRMARARGEPNEILEIYKEKYMRQRTITALMTGDKKSSWESSKIKETWNDSKKFWVMIKELLGKKREVAEEAYIYNDEGEQQEIMTCEDTFTKKWTDNIYQKLKKADFTFWYGSNEQKGIKDQMIEELENGNPDIMENPIIEEKEFRDVINDMKNGRASGVDDIPAEAMKVMIKDKDVLRYLLKCFNRALVEEVHEDWLMSKTAMIPKKDKPGILDHRPIAVTVNSSKIVSTILRKKIEEFLKEKGIVYDNQFGFTEGGRVEHCMFMLDYITNMSYEKIKKAGHTMYFAFIDFKKAYDSIDRQKLIEVLISFNINPMIIELIVQMYQADSTIIKLGKMNKKVEVTSGIRQGCCISTLLFKLVKFRIIDDLRKKEKYRIRKFCDNSLWLADDATLISEKLETLLELLDCLSEVGGKYGLEINKEKTKIMKIRGPDEEVDIGDYEMVKEAKYFT